MKSNRAFLEAIFALEDMIYTETDRRLAEHAVFIAAQHFGTVGLLRYIFRCNVRRVRAYPRAILRYFGLIAPPDPAKLMQRFAEAEEQRRLEHIQREYQSVFGGGR